MAVTLACAQFTPVNGDIQKNLRHIGVSLAAAGDADIVVFPEMAVTGYLPAEQIQELAETIPGPSFNLLAEYARHERTALAAGMAELDVATGLRYNTLVVINSKGQLVMRYRKTHLWTGEEAWATPGSKINVAMCDGIVLGGWICYDTRFPEVARLLALSGAQVAAVSSAWLGPAEEWELAVRSRAMDNNMFVVAANLQGKTGGGEQLNGDSIIVGPSGTVLARTRPGMDEVVLAEVDMGEIATRRKRLPLLMHRRKDLYQSLNR